MKPEESKDKVEGIEKNRNNSMLTERLTETSSQKKVIAVPRPNESGLELGSENIVLHSPSHIKDAEEKMVKLK